MLHLLGLNNGVICHTYASALRPQERRSSMSTSSS